MTVDYPPPRLKLQLGIRSKYRGPAFRAVEAVLREDPVLNKEVETWRSCEGLDDDTQEPKWDQMPLIALAPAPRPNLLQAINYLEINFAVSVELFVPGICVDDIIALWEAVEDAVVKRKPFRPGVPGQETVMDFLCRAISPAPTGVRSLYAAEPAFPAFRMAKGDGAAPPRPYLYGAGTLAAYIQRPA